MRAPVSTDYRRKLISGVPVNILLIGMSDNLEEMVPGLFNGRGAF